MFHDSNFESATLYSDLFRKVLKFSGSYGCKGWRGVWGVGVGGKLRIEEMFADDEKILKSWCLIGGFH